jgi:plasmid maintenance system killer protein
MAWFQYLWPFGNKRRERLEAEREASHEFQEQLQEALLRQDDLIAATARMKAERELRAKRAKEIKAREGESDAPKP